MEPFHELLGRLFLYEAFIVMVHSLFKEHCLNPLLEVFQYFFLLSVILWTFGTKQRNKVKSRHAARAGLVCGSFLNVRVALVA